MTRRLTALAATVVAAFAAACDQSTPADPLVDEPRFDKPPASAGFSCVFTGNPSLRSSASSYFTNSTDQSTARSLIDAMEAARSAGNTALLREKGFALLSLVGTVSRGSTPGDRAVGALLTKQDFNCMFDTRPNGPNAVAFEGWPDDPHYDFAAALDADNGGAYYVRGGSEQPTTPVVGNLATGGNVSALGPPLPTQPPLPPINDTWPEVLGQRVLFFGEPVADGYDWKVLPRNAAFVPYAIVALCQGVNGGGQEYDDADMVHQFGVGTLGFINSGALCSTAPPVASLQSRGPFGMLARLSRAATGMFSPEPLYASSAAVATSRGGTVGGAKGDEFTFFFLPTVDLVVTPRDLGPKNTVKVNSGRFSVTVDVTTPDDPATTVDESEPAGGITVTLSAALNNGTGTAVFEITPAGMAANYTGCDPASEFTVTPQRTTLAVVGPGGTPAPTQAVWEDNLCLTKTGTTSILASSVAAGNNAAGIATLVPAAKRISSKP